jgi:RNA polymerase sigma factor for flagellar operon FliA
VNNDTVEAAPHIDVPRRARDDELVMRFLPVIRKIAGSLMRRLPPTIRIDDLEAAGVVGLLQAAQLRDPTRPDQFESYVKRKVEGAMLDELRRLDVLPKDARSLSRRIVSAMRAVERRTGAIEEEEVARELGVSVAEYRLMLERTADVRILSIDHPMFHEGKRKKLDVALDEPTALENMLEEERCNRVATALRRLPDKHRKVLALYYLEDLNMKEISLVLSITTARVCQLHSEGVHAVRSMLQAEEEAT